jgi:hypothetical protein
VTVTTTTWVDQWRAGGEAGDAHALADAMTPDATLISPLTDAFVFRGQGEIKELLTSVFEVYRDVHVDAPIWAGNQVVLTAAGRVGKLSLAEVQVLRLTADGRISEATIFMRPLPAVTHFLRLLGPRVARRQDRAGTARLLTAAGALLDSVAGTGDRRFIPLARPDSAR